MDKSKLIGMKVMSIKEKAIGEILKIEDNIVYVSFHGDIQKYAYPSCFAKSLELEDEEIQSEAETEGSYSSFDDFKLYFKNGIANEINYLRSNGGKRYRAIDGERIHSKVNEYVYAFDTDSDLHFPDGTVIKIRMPDRIVSAYVISCEEFTIVIKSMENLGPKVDEIEFTSEQWQLLEMLTDRLDEMRPDTESIAYEIACKGAKQINSHSRIQCGQNAAYRRATSEKITFIWGPPGTGKTETLANIALDYMERGYRILMVSYSNVSVDGALLRVAQKADYPYGTVVRYGYPRMKELVDDYKKLVSYQYVLSEKPDLAEEYKSLISQKHKLKKRAPERIKINRRLAMIREKLADQEKLLIQNAQFVATTISKTVADETLYSQRFDAVIFDEASMAYVPQVVFAAGLAKKHFICLGDYCQLPPIVQNKSDNKLYEDIFSYTKITEAVENESGHNWLVMMNIQHRMHHDIADIANRYMYNGMLKTSDDIFQSRKDIAECEPMSNKAVSLIDLSNTYSVCFKTNDESRINLLSAMICIRIADMFIDKYEVGIITPYSAQARLILTMIRDLSAKDKRYSRIASATVHQFQGSQKPVIIYDAVDCFRMPYPGTLLTAQKNNLANRLFNVAITRTQGKLILVANSDYFARKNISPNLIFTNVIREIKKQGSFLAGDDILDSLFTDEVDNHAIYMDGRYESWDKYLNDIRNAKKKIQIDIPGLIDENDEAISDLVSEMKSKKADGTDISIRVSEEVTIPKMFQEFEPRYQYVTTPVTIIDGTVIWFGQPIASPDFISEGDIIETEYFPCMRFEGKLTARILQAFCEM